MSSINSVKWFSLSDFRAQVPSQWLWQNYLHANGRQKNSLFWPSLSLSLPLCVSFVFICGVSRKTPNVISFVLYHEHDLRTSKTLQTTINCKPWTRANCDAVRLVYGKHKAKTQRNKTIEKMKMVSDLFVQRDVISRRRRRHRHIAENNSHSILKSSKSFFCARK